MLRYSVNRYRASEKIGCKVFDFDKSNATDDFEVTEFNIESQNDALKTDIVFTANKNISEKTEISLLFERKTISEKCYIFAPAALYNGNKFRSCKIDYPPMFTHEQAETCKEEAVITDVPRLEKSGSSRVQLSVGDLSVPCFGYFNETEQEGFLVFFGQKNEAGDFGVSVIENDDDKTLCFELSSPCVREKYKYSMCSTKEPSDDRGISFKAGEKITFSFREYKFKCCDTNAFFNKFFEIRTEGLPRSFPNCVPWSYANMLIENKYNERNWVDSPGFYKSSEAESSVCRQWQTGWVGGCINTLPGFASENSLTRERSKKTLDFVFKHLQHKSGFLYGIYCDGRPYGDCFNDNENTGIVMSRKNADAMYFIAKQLLLLLDSGKLIDKKWENGLKKLADAFCTLYQKNGDFGQFIDIDSMSLFVPGSASAAIAPAGLALCSEYFGCADYLELAEKSASQYYNNYIKKGYTNGGPGEILACPDSESAFAALESFTVLYSLTKKDKWLSAAVDCACLCSSWCVAYDYEYSPHTQLYKRGISTTGAVWASVQNKHAAPGICTLSASSLFKLFRATGNIKFLELCRDISHNITQFVSTPDKPFYASYIWHNRKCTTEKERNAQRARKAIADIKKHPEYIKGQYKSLLNPTGRINERVNLSDWEGKNNVGEVPLGSCWPEVSVMLTQLEVPSVYIQTDTAFCFTLDHVTAKAVKLSGGSIEITLNNPTDYDAQYRLFIENSSDCSEPIKDFAYRKMRCVSVGSKETKTIKI